MATYVVAVADTGVMKGDYNMRTSCWRCFLSSFFFAVIVLNTARCWSHPTGNMMVVGEQLLWSYIYPLDDAAHRACVMVWEEGLGARPWLLSEHASSDWMIAPKDSEAVYLVERYYDAGRDGHKVRLLEAALGGEPVEIWPWEVDTHRMGEGGFAVLADGRVLFARYPNIYVKEQGRAPKIWRAWSQPVNAIRSLDDGRLLIRSNEEIWLVSAVGDIEQYWGGLLQEVVGDMPFGGNRLFDADFGSAGLWIAYWGQRRFELHADGRRSIANQLQNPWLPHAVAATGQGAFLLASSLDPGHAIRPQLWRWTQGDAQLIWSGQQTGNTQVEKDGTWGEVKLRPDSE